MIPVTLIFALIITSCGKHSGYKKTDSGLYYKFFTQNKDSVKADTTRIATLSIMYRTTVNGKDSVLFNSSEKNMPFELKVNKPMYPGDIFEAIGMMHKGDSASFILNAGQFFLKTAQAPKVPEGIDSTADMIFNIRMLKVQTMDEYNVDKAKALAKKKDDAVRELQEYLKKNNVTATPSATGVYVIQLKPATGRAIQKGDFVKIHFSVSLTDGKKLFSTHDNDSPMTVEYGQPFDTKGFDEALGTLKEGESARFVVPGEMAFGERGRRSMSGEELVAPYATVIYDVEVLDVSTKAEHEKQKAAEDAAKKKAAETAKASEPSLIQKYLADNKITAKPTASGLYYIEKVKGKGKKAENGKKVQMNYTGRLLDGTKFDSNLDHTPVKPFEFVLGQKQVIAGWDEAILLMNEGGKATFIIPSKLAYGEREMGGKIKAYSPLVFDVELVKVADK
jgi:FKBP-type peptidyl-prolyl cis-trans isomerase